MEEIKQKDIDWLLNLNSEIRSPEDHLKADTSSSRKWSLAYITAGLFTALFSAILPFFVLIRSSVYLNLNVGMGPWASLVGGIMSVIILLCVYLIILIRRSKNRQKVWKYGSRVIVAVVTGFCLYGLIYVSSLNAKDQEIRSVYRSLHPIMRIAVSTITLADNDLLITDISRTPSDYERMGLPLNESSLHFRQSTGYVHATDLRTIGHSEFRNKSLEWTFELLGIKTIRHTGTADHLHVYLPL